MLRVGSGLLLCSCESRDKHHADTSWMMGVPRVLDSLHGLPAPLPTWQQLTLVNSNPRVVVPKHSLINSDTVGCWSSVAWMAMTQCNRLT